MLVKTHRRVRPWFFEQDGGWYVQCRYGARVIAADGTNNAVFVKSLAEVGCVLMPSSMQLRQGSWMRPLARVQSDNHASKPGQPRQQQMPEVKRCQNSST